MSRTDPRAALPGRLESSHAQDSDPSLGMNLTLADRLAADIGQAVVDGVFVPGSRLDETKLAERFEVSRTPVREALRQLAASGLIEMRPRRGAVVTAVTSEQLGDLFVAMAEIEATCARLSALSMNPIERKRLGALHLAMEKLAKRGAEQDYANANREFHLAIYGGAHNKTLFDFASSMRRRLDPFRRAQFRAPDRLKRSHAEHEAVVQAIMAGDATAAHSRMHDHVLQVEDAFENLLRRR